MRLEFTQEERDKKINEIFFEEDDVLLVTEYIEGDGTEFQAVGTAIINEERYTDFVVQIALSKAGVSTVADVLEAEWEWYDFSF